LIDARRWTIRRVMAVIAILAPLLALARYPFALGFAVASGLIALFVGHSLRGRHYGRVAGLIDNRLPFLPLLLLYLTWGVITLRYARRSSVGFLDGIFGISDIGAMVCLVAYVGCVSIWLGGLKRQDAPELRRAAKRVVLLMPPAWVGFFAFTLWDPFGALGFLFH
jgi:vacuolar-type H+-ATPase subunit I/STV1